MNRIIILSEDTEDEHPLAGVLKSVFPECDISVRSARALDAEDGGKGLNR